MLVFVGLRFVLVECRFVCVVCVLVLWFEFLLGWVGYLVLGGVVWGFVLVFSLLCLVA